jgi:hypothetical protein
MPGLQRTGTADRSVTVDVMLFPVLRSPVGWTYLAWNAGAVPIEVSFGDGTKLVVPAHALARQMRAGG